MLQKHCHTLITTKVNELNLNMYSPIKIDKALHVCTPYQITGSHARSRLAYAELAAIALNCCLTNCQLVTTINVYPFPQSYLNNAVSVVPSPLTAPSLSNVTELLIKRKRAPKQIVPDNISMKTKQLIVHTCLRH